MLYAKQSNHRFAQRGVALISVLLVFSLITILASDMLALAYRDVKKTQNQINSRQSYYYALGGEQLARQLLRRDYEQDIKAGSDTTSDSLSDLWAQQFDSFNINEGEMQISIQDLQGRYNLNSLYDTKNKQLVVEAVDGFKALERQMDSRPKVSAALVDWLDHDKVASPAGAEDSIYTAKASPYLSAGNSLFDISELRLIEGGAFEVYGDLKDHISTLPQDALVNINTATQAVLKAIVPALTQAELNQIFKVQQRGGQTTLEKWFTASYGNKLRDSASLLSVSSEYFEVKIKSLYDGRVTLLSTTLYRSSEDGSIRVIKRKLTTS